MKKMKLVKGDVLQLNPEYPDGFGGMLIVCEEPKTWGCQGYLMSAYDFEACKFKGRAWLRPKFGDMEYIGKLQWIIKDDEESAMMETADSLIF
jgi:hypothetical protein